MRGKKSGCICHCTQLWWGGRIPTDRLCTRVFVLGTMVSRTKVQSHQADNIRTTGLLSATRFVYKVRKMIFHMSDYIFWISNDVPHVRQYDMIILI